MKHTLASTGHKEHRSKVFGALASHLSAEGAGLAGGPSLGAHKAEARRFHVVARGPVLDLSQISALECCYRSSQQNTLHSKGGDVRNVAFGLELRGVAKPQREEIAVKYIKDVGLSGFEQSYPHELSGGMRQRVGLARALSVDAQVLLMDEPFSAVDEQTRRKFQEDLLSLVQNENKTFLFVTHSIEEAVYVSDQIAILLPRPSRVSEIIRPTGFRNKDKDRIRRDAEYLDIVDKIWASLRTYVE